MKTVQDRKQQYHGGSVHLCRLLLQHRKRPRGACLMPNAGIGDELNGHDGEGLSQMPTTKHIMMGYIVKDDTRGFATN